MQDEPWTGGAYVCPLTHAPLCADGASLRSPGGDAVYPIRNGIPQLLRFATTEDEKGREWLARLNRLARSHGWEPALHEAGRDSHILLDYVLHPARASF